MAITLGSIKQFISDNANNASDTMADRVMDRIVQDALREPRPPPRLEVP